MRGRICLAASLVAVATTLVGGAVAGSATASAAGAKAKKLVLRCSIAMSVVPPTNAAAVQQPPTEGWQYGHMQCPKKGFGDGVEASSFNVPLSGDTVGSYVQYFSRGTIRGKFDLVPQEVSLDGGFESAAWVGKLTVTGATGIYKGIKALKNPALMTCASSDTVHLACTERLKLVLPATP